MNTTSSFQSELPEDAAQAPSAQIQAPEQTFEHFIHGERTRLSTAREQALEKRAEVEARITAIDTELAAIEAYDAAKRGKPRRSTRSNTRRTGRRAEVLEAIKRHPHGMTRGDLLTAMGATDHKTKESITNALSALKRADKVTGKDGVYAAV